MRSCYHPQHRVTSLNVVNLRIFLDRRKRMLEAWQSPLTSKDVMVWSAECWVFVVNFAYLLETILYEKNSSNSWVLY